MPKKRDDGAVDISARLQKIKEEKSEEEQEIAFFDQLAITLDNISLYHLKSSRTSQILQKQEMHRVFSNGAHLAAELIATLSTQRQEEMKKLKLEGEASGQEPTK